MKKIILDCDPGHDDAMAILLAHGSPEIELVAITTVAGNQTLDKTSLNARRVCTVAGIRDVLVAAGCARPMIDGGFVVIGIRVLGVDGQRGVEPLNRHRILPLLKIAHAIHVAALRDHAAAGSQRDDC